MSNIQKGQPWRKCCPWIRSVVLFCWGLCFFLLLISYNSRYDYVYELPENVLSLYLEQGAFQWSVNDHVQNEFSVRYSHLSGSDMATEIQSEKDQNVHIFVESVIGRLKIAFVSSRGKSTFVEVSEGDVDIYLPAESYKVYCIGTHFWGKMRLTTENFQYHEGSTSAG